MFLTKQRIVVRTDLHRMTKAFLIAIGWMIGIEAVIAMLNLLSGQETALFNGVVNVLRFGVAVTPFVYFLISPYSTFKWTIQNGISRRTMWQGQMLSVLLVTIAQEVFMVLLGILNGTQWSSVTLNGSQISYLQSLLVELLICLATNLTGLAMGEFFGLLNRKWKTIMAIGVPIILGFAIYYLVIFLDWLHPFNGDDLMLNNSAAKRLVMTIMIISYVGWTILMWFVSWISVRHMQLRRDKS